jgi:hypothetical protein
MQAHTITDVVAREHIDDLLREARQARLAAKARRKAAQRPQVPSA